MISLPSTFLLYFTLWGHRTLTKAKNLVPIACWQNTWIKPKKRQESPYFPRNIKEANLYTECRILQKTCCHLFKITCSEFISQPMCHPYSILHSEDRENLSQHTITQGGTRKAEVEGIRNRVWESARWLNRPKSLLPCLATWIQPQGPIQGKEITNSTCRPWYSDTTPQNHKQI